MQVVELKEIVEDAGDHPLRLFGALRNYIREQKLPMPAVVVRLQVRPGFYRYLVEN